MSFGTKVKIGSIGALALLAISGSLNAAPSFELIQGDVALVQAGSKMKAAIGQSLGGSATVLSSGDGKAVIRFDDGQVVVMSGNTEFKVLDYRYSKATPADSKSDMELVKGEIRYIAGALVNQVPELVKISSQGSVVSPSANSDFIMATGSLYISIALASPTNPVIITQGTQVIKVTQPGFYEIKSVPLANGGSQLTAQPVDQAALTTQNSPQANVKARMESVTRAPVNGTTLPSVNTAAYGTQQVAGQVFTAATGQTLAVTNAALGAFTITAPVAVGAAVAAVTLAATGNDKNSTTGTTGTTGTTP